MAETAEQHHDRVKDLHEQAQLAAGWQVGRPAPARWVKTCGHPGPYAVRQPTPRMVNRLQVLTCTRPDGHPGAFHMHADPDGVVLAKWGRDGRPDWPPALPAVGERPEPEVD